MGDTDMRLLTTVDRTDRYGTLDFRLITDPAAQETELLRAGEGATCYPGYLSDRQGRKRTLTQAFERTMQWAEIGVLQEMDQQENLVIALSVGQKRRS
jgi:hypothetical protein